MMNDDKAVSSKHPTWADTNDTEQSRHWSDKLESPPQQLKEDVAKTSGPRTWGGEDPIKSND